MHREWNPKAFFKKISPAVMTRFEAKRGLVLNRDPDRPEHDQTYYAWAALPEHERLALEAELLPVNDLCAAHARPYVDLLAKLVWIGADAHLVAESLEWSVNDLAMRLFTDAPEEFARCHQGYAVDMMEHFKEYSGKHPVRIMASDEAKAAMKAAMAEHFRQHVGGARCQVEDFDGDGKFALFIYHEEEMTPVERFDDKDTVVPEWQRPVVRIAAVFYPDTCTLLVKAPRIAERERLRDLFAEIFVGETDYFEDTSKTPRWSFATLAREEFDFPTHPADGIDDVCVTRVTADPAHADVKRAAIDLVPGLSMIGVHEALKSQGVDLRADAVDGVRLQFRFAHGKGRGRFRTVSLFNPNTTNLRDTRRDRVIRRYLKEWGIDGSKSAFALAPARLKA